MKHPQASGEAFGRLFLRWASALVVVAAFGATGCGDGREGYPAVGAGGSGPGNKPGQACAVPADGCACENEGQEVACGETQEQQGDYLTCAMGTRTCLDGA